MSVGGTAFAAFYFARELHHSHTSLDTARRDAEALSLLDPITGLANRRAFDAESYLRASAGCLGGTLMIDIDHFKSVNGKHGHNAGDAVLQSVVLHLSGAIRRGELAARLGGDEFAVLLDGPLTTDGLRRVADAVRGATASFAAQTSAGQVSTPPQSVVR